MHTTILLVNVLFCRSEIKSVLDHSNVCRLQTELRWSCVEYFVLDKDTQPKHIAEVYCWNLRWQYMMLLCVWDAVQFKEGVNIDVPDKKNMAQSHYLLFRCCPHIMKWPIQRRYTKFKTLCPEVLLLLTAWTLINYHY